MKRDSCVLCLALMLCVGDSPIVAQAKRPVSVADMIGMTKWADQDYWSGATWENARHQGRVAQFSPDGKNFVAVFRKGNIDNNTNEFSALLWPTREMFHSPRPTVLLRMVSSSNREAIADLTWLPDNETIAFLGESPGELRQLYVYNCRTRALKKLTSHPTNLVSYALNNKAKMIVYLAEQPAEALWDEKAAREGLIVSNQSPGDLVAGWRDGKTTRNRKLQIFEKSPGKHSRHMSVANTIPLDAEPLLSPDGKFVLIPTEVSNPPTAWKDYTAARVQSMLMPEAPYVPKLTQYTVINTLTGESRPILDAPMESRTIVWAPDGRSVAMESTFLPLDGTASEEREQRQRQPFAAQIDVLSGSITRIDAGGLRLVGWDRNKNCLVFEPVAPKSEKDEPAPGVYFQKHEGLWQRIAAVEKASECDRPEIELEEDMNVAPKLFAHDPRTGAKSLLLDLNPQFKDLQFGKVEELTWRGTDGHVIKGGLYYPPEYVSGARYPLVIQTHAWFSRKFWIDGPWTTSFAAQVLAGKGMLVLQTDELGADPNNHSIQVQVTPKEAGLRLDGIDSAIDYLIEKGLVDPNRIGIIGFSRTCFTVKYALIHSKHRFAAASVTDGIDTGYFQYVLNAPNNPQIAWEYARMNGGPPWGGDLRNWTERSPSFGIDKVQTPVRIVALNSGDSLLGEWEWFSALHSLGRPVELVVIQDGVHILQKPWDRLVSQQGTVDWFCFWLEPETRVRGCQGAQFACWLQLRDAQRRSSVDSGAR